MHCYASVSALNLLSVSLSFLLIVAIQAKCIQFDNLYQIYSYLFVIHLLLISTFC